MELGMISSTWLDTKIDRLEGIRKAKAIGFEVKAVPPVSACALELSLLGRSPLDRPSNEHSARPPTAPSGHAASARSRRSRAASGTAWIDVSSVRLMLRRLA